MKNETPSQYLARIGSKGGRASGARKRRTPEQIAELSRRGVAARKRKATQAAHEAEQHRKAAEAEAELRADARACDRRRLNPPRTFGDLLLAAFPLETFEHACAFCDRNGGGVTLRKYSTRRHVCDRCIDARRSVVLPSVKKREAFEARMQAAGRQVRS